MRKRRFVVGILTAFLAGMAVFAWLSGMRQQSLFVSLGCGIILGSTYVFLGRLPRFMEAMGNIHSEDDPQNIPPSIYLPLLLLFILAAGLLLWWTLR